MGVKGTWWPFETCWDGGEKERELQGTKEGHPKVPGYFAGEGETNNFIFYKETLKKKN